MNRLGILLCIFFVLCISRFEFGAGSPIYAYYKQGLKELELRRDDWAKYSIVIDAGRRGTRISAFAFEVREGKLLGTYYLYHKEVTPGLSHYANDTEKGVDQIRGLVELAQTKVPVSKRAKTPLMLKATAGFLELPEEETNRLLDAIRAYFATTGFKVRPKYVSTFKKRKERVFYWMAINLLMDRLEDNDVKTVATINLGREATQIAFTQTVDKPFTPWQQNLSNKIEVYGNTFDVFTYSYSGLGLREARIKILSQGKIIKSEKNDGNKYRSPCIHPTIKKSWKYNDTHYRVRGMANASTVDVDKCVEAIQAVLGNYRVRPEMSLEGREVLGTTHFYRLAIRSALTEKGENVTVTVDDVRNRADELCKTPNLGDPFLCMDLLYMSEFLKTMYGLTSATKIQLMNRINGNKISWTLAMAFMNYEKEKYMVDS